LKDPSELTPDNFIKILYEAAVTDGMKSKIKIAEQLLQKDVTDEQVVDALGEDFQIRAIDTMGTVIWLITKHWKDPEECLIHAVNLGGDTDTVAAIVGALCGALHGTAWIPWRWWNNIENEKRGRDYTVELGKQLAKLDLKAVLEPSQSEIAEIESESAKINIMLTGNLGKFALQ